LFRRKRQREETAADTQAAAFTIPEQFQSVAAIRPDGMIDAPELTPTAVFAGIGNHTAAHVDYVHQFIDSLPAEVRRAVATPAGAKSALCALLLDQGEARQVQLAIVTAAEGPMAAEAADRLGGLIEPFGVRARMPVLALAMESLRSLDLVDRHAVIKLATDLVNADGKVTLGEFVLLTLCRSQLATPLRRPAPPRHFTLQSAAAPAATILTLIARAAEVDGETLAMTIGKLGLTHDLAAAPRLSFGTVEAALEELKLLEPKSKGHFVDACIQLVMADDRLTAKKSELMRAICAAIEVPLPPFLNQLPAE